MQPSAFERDEPRLIERPQGAAAALLHDATQAGSQPAGPSRSHGSASSSVPGASAGAQMYLCGGACGSMLEMTAFSKAQLKKLRKGGQGSCITCTEAAERMRQHTIPLSEEEARRKRQKVQAVQVRQLNLSRAFARNAGAGRGVHRRETPVQSAFGGRNRPKIAKIFARASARRGVRAGETRVRRAKKACGLRFSWRTCTMELPKHSASDENSRGAPVLSRGSRHTL